MRQIVTIRKNLCGFAIIIAFNYSFYPLIYLIRPSLLIVAFLALLRTISGKILRLWLTAVARYRLINKGFFFAIEMPYVGVVAFLIYVVVLEKPGYGYLTHLQYWMTTRHSSEMPPPLDYVLLR